MECLDADVSVSESIRSRHIRRWGSVPSSESRRLLPANHCHTPDLLHHGRADLSQFCANPDPAENAIPFLRHACTMNDIDHDDVMGLDCCAKGMVNPSNVVSSKLYPTST